MSTEEIKGLAVDIILECIVTAYGMAKYGDIQERYGLTDGEFLVLLKFIRKYGQKIASNNDTEV